MNMSRPILILLSKDGTFRYAMVNSLYHRDLIRTGYLPCTSVETEDDAQTLMRLTCKKIWDSPDYRYTLDGTVDGLIRAGKHLETVYLKLKSRVDRK